LTEKVIPAAAKLAQDASQEARQHARSALQTLSKADKVAFERATKRYLTQNTARNLEKIVGQQEVASKLNRRFRGSTRRQANSSRMTL